MGYVIRNGVLVPKRKLELPKRSHARRSLPDARFPHVWIPRVIPVRAAVAVDAVSTAFVTTTNTSYTGTANLTIGAALSNSALTIYICWPSLVTATTVHWDSAGTNQLMTSIGAATNSTGLVRAELFGLIAPTAGNKNINVTWTGGSDEIQIFAVSWTGVNQTGGATSFAHVTTGNNQSLASNGVLTLSVTSAVGNAVIAGYVNDFTWATPTPCNQTQLYASNGGTIAGCANRAAGNTTVSMTATNGATADNGAGVGCDIVAAAGGGDTLLGQDQKLIMM